MGVAVLAHGSPTGLPWVSHGSPVELSFGDLNERCAKYHATPKNMHR